MHPTIYVLSLERSSDRRETISKHLNDMGVAFTFFDAIDAKQEPDYPLFKRYNHEKYTKYHGKNSGLRLGELGCFASHYRLWELCVAQNQALIILEDDAELSPAFLKFLSVADEIANKYPCIWLNENTKRKVYHMPLESINHLQIAKFSKGFVCTFAYMISPTAAKALLAYTEHEWNDPVDDTMERFFEHGVEAYGFVPHLVNTRPEEASTINQIEYRRKAKKTWFEKLCREYLHLKYDLKRLKHNLNFKRQLKIKAK